MVDGINYVVKPQGEEVTNVTTALKYFGHKQMMSTRNHYLNGVNHIDKEIKNLKENKMRSDKIVIQQVLINKIRSKVEFTYPKGSEIPDTKPELLHRSKNPSFHYSAYEDVYSVVDSDDILVTVSHLDGTYDVLRYKH